MDGQDQHESAAFPLKGPGWHSPGVAATTADKGGAKKKKIDEGFLEDSSLSSYYQGR